MMFHFFLTGGFCSVLMLKICRIHKKDLNCFDDDACKLQIDKCQAITDVTECRTINSIHKRKAFDVTEEQVTNVTNLMEQEETFTRSYIDCTNH